MDSSLLLNEINRSKKLIKYTTNLKQQKKSEDKKSIEYKLDEVKIVSLSEFLRG